MNVFFACHSSQLPEQKEGLLVKGVSEKIISDDAIFVNIFLLLQRPNYIVAPWTVIRPRIRYESELHK